MNTDTEYAAPAGTLIKTTLVDYPGRVACSFFVKGCNLRCPYCYNKELVLGQTEEASVQLVSVDTVIAHLKHRSNVLTGLVISGGEPLLNPIVPDLIKIAKSLGYKIKLDTNGTLPDKLQLLLSNEQTRPDFIAMDIKTDPDRYEQLMMKTNDRSSTEKEEAVLYKGDFVAKKESVKERLVRSIKLISTYPAENREFRTVLVPGLVSDKDIEAMAAVLPQDASWQFAQFRNENCLDPLYDKVSPYLDGEVKKLVSIARQIIPGAALR